MNHLGVYRGTVVNAEDPASQGRLQLSVPAVYGLSRLSPWAMPLRPAGVLTATPAPGTPVWVLFEGGDEGAPVWAGVGMAAHLEPPTIEYVSLAAFLGLQGTVAALAGTLNGYVTLETTQTVTGDKDFTGTTTVNGSKVLTEATGAGKSFTFMMMGA